MKYCKNVSTINISLFKFAEFDMGEKYLIDKSHSPLLPLKNGPYCLPFPDISKYVKKLKKKCNN